MKRCHFLQNWILYPTTCKKWFLSQLGFWKVFYPTLKVHYLKNPPSGKLDFSHRNNTFNTHSFKIIPINFGVGWEPVWASQIDQNGWEKSEFHQFSRDSKVSITFISQQLQSYNFQHYIHRSKLYKPHAIPSLATILLHIAVCFWWI